MTDGHKHRNIDLPLDSLRMRLLTMRLISSTDSFRVGASRWTWASTWQQGSTVYVLTPLGIAHTLFGLTVTVYIR